jgi:hypothetical protein
MKVGLVMNDVSQSNGESGDLQQRLVGNDMEEIQERWLLNVV